MVGKWHLGFPTLSHWPTHRGFDSFYGFLSSAVDYWNKTSLNSETVGSTYRMAWISSRTRPSSPSTPGS